jgi:hypothetical protein
MTIRVVALITIDGTTGVNLRAMTVTGKSALSGKNGLTVANVQGRLLVAMITMIAAPGLRLLVGGIMKRENLQGMTTTGDVTIVQAGAMKGTNGTTIELLGMPMATVDGRVKGLMVVRGLHRAAPVHCGLAISFRKWSTRALALACYGTSRTAVLTGRNPLVRIIAPLG